MTKYLARLSLDDDEAEVLEAATREALAEAVVNTVMDWAHNLLETEGHRLPRLIAACGMIQETGTAVLESVEKFLAGAELPLITDLWEFHEVSQDPRDGV